MAISPVLPTLTSTLITKAPTDAKVASATGAGVPTQAPITMSMPISPPLLPVVRDITAHPIYTDAKGSVVDNNAVTFNHTQNAVLIDSIHAMDALGDKALAGDQTALNTMVANLKNWAKQGEMLGTMSSTEARYMRNSLAAGLSLAYYKIADKIAKTDRPSIDAYMTTLAKAVQFTSDAPIGNLYYWSGVTNMAVGAATNNSDLKKYAETSFNKGLSDINADGYLSAELARGTMALAYNNRAMDGLVMMAEIAARTGQNWYAKNNNALQKAAKTISLAEQNPSLIAKKAGVTSVKDSKTDPVLSWFTLYNARFPNQLPYVPAGNFNEPDMGGDITALAHAWVHPTV